MELENFENLAEVLNFELTKRKCKNNNYSLRSFAKLLEISPSQLSLILKNEKGLSKEKAQSIGKILGYNKLKVELFVAIVEKDFARSKAERNNASQFILKKHIKHSHKFHGIDDQDFVFEWYHLAIRQLTLLEDFEFNASWISRRLGITVSLATKSMKELLNNKLIVKDKNGKYKIKNTITIHWQGNDGIRHKTNHRQKLSQALIDKKSRNPDCKIFDRSTYVAINSNQYDTLKNLILQLTDQVDELTLVEPKNSLLFFEIAAIRLDE